MGYELHDSMGEELLVLLARICFVSFCFLLELKKSFDLVQSLRIAYELNKKNVEVTKIYLIVTWVENSPPVCCGLVVPIVACQVHQNWKHRGVIHTELNYICIRHL